MLQKVSKNTYLVGQGMVNKKMVVVVTTLNIVETNSNVFLNLLDRKKKIIVQVSGGHSGFKGSRRHTPLSGELLGKRLATEAALRKIKYIGVKVKGAITPVVRGVLRGLQTVKLRFLFLQQLKNVAHNGVRKSKPRRL